MERETGEEGVMKKGGAYGENRDRRKIEERRGKRKQKERKRQLWKAGKNVKAE